MPPSEDPFRAIGDPTRRAILDLLAEHGDLTVRQLASHFPALVESGISKHLMVLRAAGLVVSEKQGRTRRYRVNADGLNQALWPWIARYERYWTGSLDQLRVLTEQATDHRDSTVAG